MRNPLFIVCPILIFAALAAGQKAEWAPVKDSDLRMSKPQVDPNADAEVLFWEVRLVDSFNRSSGWQTTVSTHLRIKIFTERGREMNSKIDIPFGSLPGLDARSSIKELAARSIKPDGTVIEVKPGDVFEREIAKLGKRKAQAKSFAVPGIEIGSIIEYRWREVREATYNYSRLMLAREMPVQYVKYWVKPANVPLGMRLHSTNTAGNFVKEADGFYSTTMTNVPAILDEPRMPSEFEVVPWVLMYYDDEDEKLTANEYWQRRARMTWDAHKAMLKPSSEVRDAALQATGGIGDAGQKIRRIAQFCRSQIRDINDDGAGFTPEEREKYKPNNSIGDVLKRKVGTWHDINLLFGAMLVSVGLDARFANVASKDDARFNRNLANDYFVRHEIVAVRIGEGWQYFEISERNIPFGMLAASFEGESVLVSDERNVIWDTIPVSAAGMSNQKRAADVELFEDGRIAGSVSIEYTGHLAADYREAFDDDTTVEREKLLTESVKRFVGDTAELSNIVIENLHDAEMPLIVRFQVSVPGYADRTGKRIFLRPNFFKRGTRPVFASATRRYDVLFHHAWSENDEVRVALPRNFAPEGLDVPRRIADEKTGSLLESKLAVQADGRLVFERRFQFGKAGSLLIYDFNYGGVKNLFDAFHGADSFSIVLRETATQ
jgi:hypothetical protein